MGLPQHHPATGFSYADYLSWPDTERWELIDGQAYAMRPAPSNFHQLIVGELFSSIHAYFRGKPAALLSHRLTCACPTQAAPMIRSTPLCNPTSAWCAKPNN